ncbi:fibrinogen C domain-containing protein 1-like [Leptodactylus fuscus]
MAVEIDATEEVSEISLLPIHFRLAIETSDLVQKLEGKRTSRAGFGVYCEMSANGGWTAIQRHDGSDGLSFYEMWDEYTRGFGHLQGEHWLGLEYIHALTHQPGRPSKLHISLGDFNGFEDYAEYGSFSVGNAENFYKLSVSNYLGTAGDAFLGDSKLSGSNQYGSLFSTPDVVNDNCQQACMYGSILFVSCSYLFHAGWWYNACGITNLNGVWREPPNHRHRTSSVLWPTWRPYESLKFSKMYLIH